jgi:hypothetical protein
MIASKILYLPTLHREKAITLWIEEFEAYYFIPNPGWLPPLSTRVISKKASAKT